MIDVSKFNDTQLPPKDQFDDHLPNTLCTDDRYEFAQHLGNLAVLKFGGIS